MCTKWRGSKMRTLWGGRDMSDRRERRRWFWGFLGAAAVVLAILGAALALHKLDREQFDADTGRMQKLQAAPLLNGGSSGVVSGEWPQWRGPNRDGLSLETGL